MTSRTSIYTGLAVLVVLIDVPTVAAQCKAEATDEQSWLLQVGSRASSRDALRIKEGKGYEGTAIIAGLAPPKDRKPIFFVHIHKAGGTTMRSYAEAQGETSLPNSSDNWNFQHETCQYLDNSSNIPCTNKASMMQDGKATFTAIERPYERASDHCSQSFIYVTMVRNPLSLMRSTILYHNMSIEQVLDHLDRNDSSPIMMHPRCLPQGDGYQHFDNFMVRMFSGYDAYLLPPGQITKAHLAKAKDVISDFDLVMILEDLDSRDLAATEELLGWDTSVKVFHNNSHSESFDFSSSQEDALTSHNWADLELYSFARKLAIEKRRSAPGLSEAYADSTGQVVSTGMSARPTATSKEPVATDVCLITAAVGEDFIRLAALTGLAKDAYAQKWNYTYLQYEWDGVNDFLDWCHATELGSRFVRQDLELNHPTLKYCVMDHALSVKGCKRALWTDADAVILNWDIKVEFSWPGAVMSASGEPYAIYSMLSLPGGIQKKTGILHNDWCLTDSPCSSFKKFWTCLNSGVFILSDSPASRQYMSDVFNATVTKMSRAVGCSTATYNPLRGDQCRLADGSWDQCISGCVWHQENIKNGHDEDHMPDGVACTDGSARPRIQEVFGVDHLEAPKRYVHEDTYVVNVVGEGINVNKSVLVNALVDAFPHLRAAFS